MMSNTVFLFLFLSFSTQSLAGIPSIELTLKSAESKAILTSHRLRAASSDREFALKQSESAFALALPRLSIQGSYQYFAQIPQVQLSQQLPPLPFGINNVFSVGPNLNYTVWDSFSSINNYRASGKMAQAKDQDLRNTEIQLLLATRSSYIQVQLAIEELRLIQNALALAREQLQDVNNHFKAGAATQLDLVVSRRGVLRYQMQFDQRQADLSVSLKELLALTGEPITGDSSHPGPEDVENATLILKLDSLHELVSQEENRQIAEPDSLNPQIQSRSLQAESLELQADAQVAKLWPSLQLTGAVTYNQPSIPTASGASPLQYWQESVGAVLSIPMYLGDPNWKLAQATRAQAIAAKEQEEQLSLDIKTNFAKSRELLQSLMSQRITAALDVKESQEAARLYYNSYRAGRINLIDVQNANVDALQSKVNSARIDAQILNQMMQLKALSGKELLHE